MLGQLDVLGAMARERQETCLVIRCGETWNKLSIEVGSININLSASSYMTSMSLAVKYSAARWPRSFPFPTYRLQFRHSPTPLHTLPVRPAKPLGQRSLSTMSLFLRTSRRHDLPEWAAKQSLSSATRGALALDVSYLVAFCSAAADR